MAFKLTAVFDVRFPNLRLEGPWRRVLRSRIDDFVVTVILAPEAHGTSKRGDAEWTHLCSEGTILVSRSEVEPLPQIAAYENGGRDTRARAEYFSIRSGYKRAAAIAAQRINNYMIHHLRQTVRGEALVEPNARWIGGTGEQIETGTSELHAVFHSIGKYSERVLLEAQDAALAAAIANGSEPTLVQTFLADAQAAAVRRHAKRFVLDLAIACEVFTKQAAFSGSDRAARIFDALEDGRFAEIQVPKLIDLLGSTSSMSRSFRQVDKAAATEIENLFRARNKVAHRGEARYRNQAGETRTVTEAEMAQWWQAVAKMMEWVESLPD